MSIHRSVVDSALVLAVLLLGAAHALPSEGPVAAPSWRLGPDASVLIDAEAGEVREVSATSRCPVLGQSYLLVLAMDDPEVRPERLAIEVTAIGDEIVVSASRGALQVDVESPLDGRLCVVNLLLSWRDGDLQGRLTTSSSSPPRHFVLPSGGETVRLVSFQTDETAIPLNVELRASVRVLSSDSSRSARVALAISALPLLLFGVSRMRRAEASR